MSSESDAESKEPKPICQLQRQAFVDCMYLNDSCIQSGRSSFSECFQEILDEKEGRKFPHDCLKLYKDFLTCRRQMVIFNFLSLYLYFT